MVLPEPRLLHHILELHQRPDFLPLQGVLFRRRLIFAQLLCYLHPRCNPFLPILNGLNDRLRLLPEHRRLLELLPLPTLIPFPSCLNLGRLDTGHVERGVAFCGVEGELVRKGGEFGGLGHARALAEQLALIVVGEALGLLGEFLVTLPVNQPLQSIRHKCTLVFSSFS